MRGNYTRLLPLLLAAALGLTPQCAQAFAFDTAVESFFVVPNQTTGSPVVWALPQVTMSVNLGSVPPGTTLANGTTSWDTSAAEVLAFWNTVVPNFFTMDTTEADPCDWHMRISVGTLMPVHCARVKPPWDCFPRSISSGSCSTNWGMCLGWNIPTRRGRRWWPS